MFFRYNQQIVRLDDQIRIGKATSNDLIIHGENATDFHAIVLKYGSGAVLITRNPNGADTSGGKPILGNLLLIESQGNTRIRLGGCPIEVQSVGGWLREKADREDECPICKIKIRVGESVWRCQRCGVMVHASEFCHPRSEICFKCGG